MDQSRPRRTRKHKKQTLHDESTTHNESIATPSASELRKAKLAQFQATQIVGLSPHHMEYFDNVYDTVKSLPKNLVRPDGTFNSPGLFTLVKKIIELVESYNMDGVEKSAIVVEIVKRLINDSSVDQVQKDMLVIWTDMMLPSTLKLVIDGTRGLIDVNNLKTKLKKLCCA
jgi:hypothetical protein